jgi:hypothetical protein
MALAFSPVVFGETTEVRCAVQERKNATFTISSASICMTNAAGSTVRSASATVDSAEAFYLETFSSANGYAENTKYDVTFKLYLSAGGLNYVEKGVGTLIVQSSPDA